MKWLHYSLALSIILLTLLGLYAVGTGLSAIKGPALSDLQWQVINFYYPATIALVSVQYIGTIIWHGRQGRRDHGAVVLVLGGLFVFPHWFLLAVFVS